MPEEILAEVEDNEIETLIEESLEEIKEEVEESQPVVEVKEETLENPDMAVYEVCKEIANGESVFVESCMKSGMSKDEAKSLWMSKGAYGA